MNPNKVPSLLVPRCGADGERCTFGAKKKSKFWGKSEDLDTEEAGWAVKK